MTLEAGAPTGSSKGLSNHDIYTERSTALRLELKAWEKDFAVANGGRKAGRDDVKKNVDIAAKYKEYNKVRDILSGKISAEPPAVKEKQTPRKRKYEAEPAQTSSKRQIMDMMTPSKPFEPWVLDPYDSPSAIRKLFATPRKTAIGPTPQKDGQVLGLFDLLQEGPSPSRTGDSKAQKAQVRLQATPRKTRAANEPVSGTQKHSRTPASASKRYMLDMFATPLKNKNANGQGEKTPSSVSKLSFATPSFLRRDSQRLPMPVVNENDDGVLLSPEMAKVPRNPIVRGLSSMLAGLREMQDEAADDDLEALHEMEAEEAGGSKPAPKKPLASDPKAVKDTAILVEDSQPHILGGFDDEAMYDSAPEEPTLDRDGKPLKVYKKKGQKRTTRRVKMKPTRSKPQKTQPEPLAPDDSEDELQEPEEDPVPETQVDDGQGFTDARNFDSDSQSEYTASEGGTRYRRPDQSKKAKRITKDGKIKTVARKVGTMAQQNFKRLKLRNSGSKGGPAHHSRFRRTKK